MDDFLQSKDGVCERAGSNDGVANTDRATIARDVMAYTLGYYQGDYQPIGAGSATAFPMQFTTQPADITGHDLYNGNISHTTVALSKFRSGDPVGYSYRYDQLNRLKQMRRHGLAANTTTWNSSSISDKFKESIVYDGNGNIKTYLRNGADETNMPLAMDNLTYVYNTAIDPVSGSPYLVNNRLTRVTDQVASGNYSQALNGTEDLDGQLANNYHYDKIGNLVKDIKENIDRIEWTVYGKIKKITKSNSDIIAYTYDAAGNRASKSVTQSGVTTLTWYVRDAQGNSLALYSDKQGGQSGMWWKEQSLYGSSRLGIWAPEINISSTNGTSEWSVAGQTVYELSNHLGNVMATITDKKIGHDPGNGIIDYYNADVTSATDYYPFGMQMPGRNWSSSTYRYGFNGKENDNEVKGTGNQQDYGMRIYDPRIGRFLSVDPLTKDYPWYTPYQFSGNMPIANVDLDGAEEEYYKLSIDAKTGKSQLSLTKKVEEKSIFWGLISWKPELERFVEYNGQTYIFGEDAEDNQAKLFSPFVQDPEGTLQENMMWSKEQSDEEFAVQAGSVVLLSTVSAYTAYGRSPTTPKSQQSTATGQQKQVQQSKQIPPQFVVVATLKSHKRGMIRVLF